MPVSKNQINVGALVNPLDGLQKGFDSAGAIFQNYVDREDKKEQLALDNKRYEERLAIEEKRWNTKDSREKAKHKVVMDEVGRKDANREYLKDYSHQDSSKLRGIEESTLRAFSNKAAPYIEELNTKYNIGTDEGQLTIGEAAKTDKYKKELKSITDTAVKGLPELEAMRTAEATYNAVYNDVLKQTGDSVVANEVATTKSNRITTKDSLVAQEKEAANDINKANESKIEALKYTVDRLDKNYADVEREATRFDKKIKNGKFRSSDFVKVANELFPSSTFLPDPDRNDLIRLANSTVDTVIGGKPVTYAEMAQVTADNYQLGVWDDDTSFGEDPKKLAKAIIAMRESKSDSTILGAMEKAKKAAKDPKMTKIITELMQKQATPLSWSELKSKVGKDAYSRELLNPDTKDTANGTTTTAAAKKALTKEEIKRIAQKKADLDVTSENSTGIGSEKRDVKVLTPEEQKQKAFENTLDTYNIYGGNKQGAVYNPVLLDYRKRSIDTLKSNGDKIRAVLNRYLSPDFKSLYSTDLLSPEQIERMNALSK